MERLSLASSKIVVVRYTKLLLSRAVGLTPLGVQGDCLSKSEDPWGGIKECKINDGVDLRDKLSLPPFRKESKEPAELTKDQQAKLLGSMVGTWTNEDTNFNQVKNWTVNESGEVKQSEVRSGEEEKKKKTLKIFFVHTNRINVDLSNAGFPGFSHSIFPVNEKTAVSTSALSFQAR